MITKDGSGYWATGITLRREGYGRPAWSGHIDFLDDGFVGDNNTDAGIVSTEGRLRTRYALNDGDTVTGLRAVVDALLADAGRLGITFLGGPYLYYEGDGESVDFPPPPGWQRMLADESERIGWECLYRQVEADRG
jgi:hypothetical protein